MALPVLHVLHTTTDKMNIVEGYLLKFMAMWNRNIQNPFDQFLDRNLNTYFYSKKLVIWMKSTPTFVCIQKLDFQVFHFFWPMNE